MKLQEHDYGFEAELPAERIAFTIKNSAKLFGILSSGIYKDKILAVIRELSCNAYDAHIAAKKKHVPFRLRLPTRLDPTFFVEDEGTGIDPAKIGEIYWTYGESTKTDSNDQIGALGLGSKSPFAYTKSSFVVKNRYNGREYIYLCFINEEGKPDGSKVSDEPTDKPSGITVEFAVRPEDIQEFRDRTARFFKRWAAVLPTFVDSSKEAVLGSEPIKKVLEGTDWYLENTNRNAYVDHAGAIAMQGNVPYPIEVGSIPRMPKDLMIIASNPFIITFDMGEVNFAASRESLEYDERTRLNLIARLQEVRTEIEQSFREKVFKPGMTHLEFLSNFRRTFREFSTTIKYDAGYGVDTEDWYVNLLCGKQKSDTVDYDSIKWKISDLISGRFRFTTQKHQSFGISKIASRTKNASRKYTTMFSSVAYNANDDILDGSIIHASWSASSLISAGQELVYEWRNAFIPKRADMTDYYRTLKHANLFSVTTTHVLSIESSVTFYVNDVGSSGEARYKAMHDNGFFVNFDPKVSSLETVLKELNELIANGMKGAVVKLISGEPDNRAVIDKVKIETGTMRAKYQHFIFENKAATVSLMHGSSVTIKKVDSVRSGEEILKIADLQAMPMVLYVVKYRSPTLLFDDAGQTSIIGDRSSMAYAAAYCFPELVKPFAGPKPTRYVGRDSLFVMILNEGQIEWLKKRKVNLINVRTLMAQRIEELEKAEGFIAKIEEATTLQNVGFVNGMYEAVNTHKKLKDRMLDTSKPSTFKDFFIKYDALKNANSTLGEAYAKMQIFETIKGSQNLGHKSSSNFILKLATEYPLLNMLPVDRYLGPADAAKVIDYIELIDSI